MLIWTLTLKVLGVGKHGICRIAIQGFVSVTFVFRRFSKLVPERRLGQAVIVRAEILAASESYCKNGVNECPTKTLDYLILNGGLPLHALPASFTPVLVRLESFLV